MGLLRSPSERSPSRSCAAGDVVSRPLARRDIGWLTLIGIIGGSIPFLLFFTGLSLASAPSAAFIHKTLFIWVAFLAVPFLGERLGWAQIAALAVLLGSQLLIVPPTGVSWGIGETMIAAATLLWSVEVVLAKRLLGRVDPLVVGVGRLGIGLVVLVGYLLVSGKLALVGSMTGAQWTWVALTGVLLAGYVGTWFSALKLAPATVVTSVLVLGAPITALLDAAVNGRIPGAVPLAGYGLVALGALAVVIAALRRPCGHARHRRRPGRELEHAMVAGPVLFARYAFGPNSLGYCGPDDAAELFGEATSDGDKSALRRQAEQFEGAYPYLQLIARANGITRPARRARRRGLLAGQRPAPQRQPDGHGRVA